ncbi:S-locus glycoprotein domain [Dillenia turbinata]|uniref:Receptor-like serine/threonine-protein kinase n=1 Tax=Dillenia turbinata TaxID=194707 RepID=A0AAN8W391_9MAGN
MLTLERFFVTFSLLLCLSLWFSLVSTIVSQIPLGSKLHSSENKFWVSSNGDFALGFFSNSDQPNQYGVGIRYNSNSIPHDKQTLVWVAGGDLRISNQSYFQLTNEGNLVLCNSKGVIAWTSGNSNVSVAFAVLKDDGNLVLMSKSQKIVWRSFDTPYNVLLPGQNLPVDRTLRAAQQNSVSSYYTLNIDADELQLRWETSVSYWKSGTARRPVHYAVVTANGALQLVDRNLEPVWSAFAQDHNDSGVNFRFLRLDADGNLRLYSWVEATKLWRSVWQAIENQCTVFATCYPHGICNFGANGFPDCTCPFSSTSELKCLAPYPLECDSHVDMVQLEYTLLYGIYPPDEIVTFLSLKKCKDLCIKDADCVAVTFMNDGTAQCRMKKTTHLSGYSFPSMKAVSFVKKCAFSNPLSVNPKTASTSYSNKVPVPCLVLTAVVTFLFFFVVQLGIGLYLHKRKNSIQRKFMFPYANSHLKGPIMFSFNEIKDLTDNFNHQIGPTMFKGMLSDKTLVSVKDLKATTEERRFCRAVSVIGSIHHKNLVKLEGYCCESGHRLLVYEFAKNGSLDRYIGHSKLSEKLSWKKRFHICLSVARAISYLHGNCTEFIIHGNLKSENVVLDENFEAKVTEFGLGRAYGETSTTAERDVEDFGKMIVMLVSGKRDEDVLQWVYHKWADGQMERVVDKRIKGGLDSEELERVLRIAFWCLHVDERMRPSMGEVVKVLEGTLCVDPPPPPICHQEEVDEEDLQLDIRAV